MAHITFLALPNCCLSGISGSIDAFSIANRWAGLRPSNDTPDVPLFSWDVVTPDGQPVVSEGRMLIQPHCAMNDITLTDFILIPAFLFPFNFTGNVSSELSDWLWSWHKKNVMIGSTCTGAFLLAETGLLDGKTATTNWYFAKKFQTLYPHVRLKADRMLTKDDGMICSGATTSYLDLCLYLIKTFGSEKLANVCSKILLRPSNIQSQSPFVFLNYRKNHMDDIVLKAQEYVEQKYTGPISIEGLSSDLGISTRHFIRRFKNATGDSPLLYLQRIRIEAAKDKLEKTKETIDEITFNVGYENTNSFRKLFKKITGLSPKAYRTQFTQT